MGLEETLKGRYLLEKSYGDNNSHRSWNAITIPAQSLQPYPTLCDPMDYSPPGSSVPWILQATVLKWDGQGILPTQGSNPGFLHRRQILYG